MCIRDSYYSDPDGQVEMSWTVPEGVESICAVAIGAGEAGERHNTDADGGNGGDLRYVNDIPVTPGETLTLGAGKGFVGDAEELDAGHSSSGDGSYLKRGAGSQATYLVYAQGGNGSGTNVGTGGDGASGGNGSSASHPKGGGGGGAGKYTGTATAAGSSNWVGKNGQGSGLTGYHEGLMGGATSGGHQNLGSGWRGSYGGGGGGMDSGATTHSRTSNGAPGGVRVIWGEDRSYPSNAGGVFPTAPAGTELEIQFHIPVNYNHNTNSPHPSRNRIHNLQIFDDNGTNLVASTGNGADYDGLTYYAYGSDNDNIGDLRDNDAITDFDDITAPGFGYNSTWDNYPNVYRLKFLFDTDHDTVGTNEGLAMVYIANADDSLFGTGSQRTDPDEYLTGANHNDNSFTNQFLFKFDSPKVIKKIHWYVVDWIPRCRILLDGNVIADDAAHFIDPDADSGHSAEHLGRRLAVFEFT